MVFDPDRLRNWNFGEQQQSFEPRDAILYALGVGLPITPVQREHELGVRAFAEGVLGGETLELRDQRNVTTERKVRFDPPLQRSQP